MVIFTKKKMYMAIEQVNEYVSDNALMQLLESDRIKDKIRRFRTRYVVLLIGLQFII